MKIWQQNNNSRVGRLEMCLRVIFLKFLLSAFIFLNAPCFTFSQNVQTEKISRSISGKLSPLLRNQRKSNQLIDIRILVSDGKRFEAWCSEKVSDLMCENIRNNIYELSGVSSTQLFELLNVENVLFIDVSNRVAIEERIMDNTDLSINNISSVHYYYPEISGDGLTLSIKEALFDTTDIDYNGRIVHLENADEKLSFHATSMASLAVGAGNSDPKGKGVAWRASLSSSTYDNLLPDDGNWLWEIGVSVQNHSYGVGVENYYGMEAQEYDQHCMEFPEIIHVFSSGNSGRDTSDHGPYAGIPGYANLTGHFKMAKNILTVGELSAHDTVKLYSSRGPAYDGRVKPELVAYGDLGSSESAAYVSGICVLIQDAYKQKFSELPSASLVKAALLNSANDVGRPEVDFEAGFGSVDAKGAVETIQERRFLESEIAHGVENIHIVSVPGNTAKIKVTVVWHDKEANPADEGMALVNDIDLELKNISTGEIWKPWILNSSSHIDSLELPAKRGGDHLNNIEQVTVDLPEAGGYEIKVNGFNIIDGVQKYSIAWEFEKDGFTWITPLNDTKTEIGETMRISWDWAGVATKGVLEFQNIFSDDWQLIDDQIELSAKYFEWETPGEYFVGRFRISTSNEVFISDTFVVSQTIQMKTGLNCEDEVMLYWSPIDNINTYQVYQIQDDFLREYAQIEDTVLFLTGDDKERFYYAVASVVEEHTGLRGKSINFTNSGTGCYIRSFYPIVYVTDTVQLKLDLASDYRLNSVTLERLSGSEYISVAIVEDIDNLQLILEDPKPNKRMNTYRVKLERDDFKFVYSEDAEVFYSNIGTLVVYPNPVTLGDEINVINGEEGEDEVNVYDPSGRLVRKYISDYGLIKGIPTENLERGIYLIEVKTELGHRKVCRVVIQ